MFRRETYARMRPILEALDGERLRRDGFALGGASRIALAHGEVRLSSDLDFLASDAAGYARLRHDVRSLGYPALFRGRDGFDLPREPTADQYGVRFPVLVGNATVKVELIREARIVLGPPVDEPGLSVPCLNIDDAFAEKLLALSDRGADPSQFDRDLVDLATLRVRVGPIPDAARDAAIGAYGPSIVDDLQSALRRLMRDSERRARSLRALSVDDVALVERGLVLLVGDHGA